MFHLDTLSTLVAATLVLLLGRKLVQTVPFLKKYTIPEPVAGGLLVALALLALKKSMDIEIDFDMSLKDPLMLAFFATIGLNANLASLRAGGKVLGTFLIVVVGLLLLQNALGIGMATLLGLDPLMGLLAGSITLSGGHGTGAAWSKLFVERYGFANATEVAMACATFGLVLGGLIGGPVARYLVKHSSSPDGTPDDQVAPTAFEKPDVGRVITSLVLIESIALIAICLTLGKVVAQLLAGSVFELPTFVCVLFIGVILSNSLALAGLYRVFDRAVSVLGNVSLSLFLAMALMSLKLWELASLALPMIIILAVQALAMALYAVFVTYRMMGKNYDAAVLAAGHCGFGLGATPTAIANMQAITDRFGPSHMAFLVVPMVGAFFIDIVNALVIKLYLLLPIFAGVWLLNYAVRAFRGFGLQRQRLGSSLLAGAVPLVFLWRLIWRFQFAPASLCRMPCTLRVLSAAAALLLAVVLIKIFLVPGLPCGHTLYAAGTGAFLLCTGLELPQTLFEAARGMLTLPDLLTGIGIGLFGLCGLVCAWEACGKETE